MNSIGHLGMAASFAALYQYHLAEFTTNSSSALNSTSILAYAYTFLCFGAAILGGKAPDWDLYFVDKEASWQDRCKVHRQITHSTILILALFAFTFFMSRTSPWWEIATYFSVGLLSHLVADIVTGTVPIGIYGDYRSSGSRIGIKNQSIKNFFIYVGQFLGPIFFFISLYQFFMFASKPGFNVLNFIKDFIGQL